MNSVINDSQYYLVVHGRGEDAILVFLGTPPDSSHGGKAAATSVTLELLPPRQRFGGTGGIAMGKPFLGRWPGSLNRFRQFLTMSELEQAGWVPVPRFRICDCSEDYFEPWSSPSYEQTTACNAEGQTGW